MGLEGVELIMAVEETFQIAIPDPEAQNFATVGEMYRYVLEKLDVRDQTGERCATSAAFYRLRRALMQVLNVSRSQVRLDTAMEQLVPLGGRREAYRLIAQASLLELPSLQRSRLLLNVLAVLSAGAGFGYLCFTGFALWNWFPGVGVGVITGSLLAYLTQSAAKCFERPSYTVRQWVTQSALLNRKTLRLECQAVLSQREVWETLREVIQHELHLPPEKIQPETRFVEDLGVGC